MVKVKAMLGIIVVFLILAGVSAYASPTANQPPPSEEYRIVKAIATATASTVIVATPLNISSGFFVDSKHVLTTYHQFVKEGARTAIVVSIGHEDYPAKIVKYDNVSDMALLEIDSAIGVPLPFSTVPTVVGQTVLTVGNPMNEGISATKGMMSKLSCIMPPIKTADGGMAFPVFSMVSIPIADGNSGGALVNLDGQVVGVISAKSTAREAVAYTVRLFEIEQFLK